MIWLKTAFSLIFMASILTKSKADRPNVLGSSSNPELIDVVIIGAGAAGAAAARTLKKHNKGKGKGKRISWCIFESQDRIGGRIHDIELGGQEDKPPTRYSGGYEPYPQSTPPSNVGCKCRGDSCPKFKVEVGAGWFTGDKGIEAKTCKKQAKSTATTSGGSPRLKRRQELREEKREEVKAFKETIAAMNGKLNKDVDCTVCPQLYNDMYETSQTQGSFKKHPLKVHCSKWDYMDEDYGFLDTGMYYGYNVDGDVEMKPIDRDSPNLPFFKKDGTSKLVKADIFLDKFWNMMDKCVDYQAYQFWYQYTYPDYYGPESSPFYSNDSNEKNTTTWYDFDVGYPGMPDKQEFWEESQWGNKNRINFCKNYHKMVTSFLEDNTSETSLDATKLYNFYRNFEYIVEFLSGQYMSFGNFGDDGGRPWGYETAYSIDQRGLKKVVERIMPKKKSDKHLKRNHKVTKVHWKIKHSSCPIEFPVLIEVDKNENELHYCAKKVISTVSLGVLDEPDPDNIFKPRIDMTESPFEELGELVKVYFRFPETFWQDDKNLAGYITFLMEEDFKMDYASQNVRAEYFYNLDHWFQNICKRGNKFCETRSLFTFLATPELNLMGLSNSTVSDKDFSDKIWHLLDPLREKHGSDFVEPDCWEFHDWRNDPNARGAYGIWKRGATYYDHIDFFQPREQDGVKVLYLSGEASCFNVWGFIEGAHEAGVRDAKHVINELTGSNLSVFSICGLQQEFDHCFTDACANETEYTRN